MFIVLKVFKFERFVNIASAKISLFKIYLATKPGFHKIAPVKIILRLERFNGKSGLVIVAMGSIVAISIARLARFYRRL